MVVFADCACVNVFADCACISVFADCACVSVFADRACVGVFADRACVGVFADRAYVDVFADRAYVDVFADHACVEVFAERACVDVFAYRACVVCRLREQLLQRLRVRAVGVVGRVRQSTRLDAATLSSGVRPLPQAPARDDRCQRNERPVNAYAGPRPFGRPQSRIEPYQSAEPAARGRHRHKRHEG